MACESTLVRREAANQPELLQGANGMWRQWFRIVISYMLRTILTTHRRAN